MSIDQQRQLVVVGGGVGGYTAAIRAARAGLAVTLAESGALGGTCLNVGCIPTKTLLHQARVFREARGLAHFGIDAGSLSVDMAAVVTKKDEAVERLVQGVRTLVRRNGITLVQGTAEFVAPRTLRIRETGQELGADVCIIATGSEPVLPRIPGIELDGVVTSDGALALRHLPRRVLIVGGGVIGVEFAQIYSDFGVAVTVVEMRERLLPEEDEEIAATLQQMLAARGIDIVTEATVRSIARANGSLEATIASGRGARKTNADLVLVAVGRRARVKELAAERAGIAIDEFIVTDDRCRTNVSGIYAIGDVRGGLLLAHKAAAEGECAVADIVGRPFGIATRVIPRAVYTSPEIACVGLTEAEARRTSATVKVGRFPFSANGKAIASGDAEGFVKVIADGATDQVVGVAMIGPDVTNLLGEATLAVQMELSPGALSETVHAHPTLTEALMGAAQDAQDGTAIHLPPRTERRGPRAQVG